MDAQRAMRIERNLFWWAMFVLAVLVILAAGCGSQQTIVKPQVMEPGATIQPIIPPAKKPVHDPAADARGRAEEAAEALEGRTLKPVYFDFDRAEIRRDQRTTMKDNAWKLQVNPGLIVTIEGHCDERGTVSYNLALGQRRAESARKYLIRLGADAGRISTISYGKERPADAGHDEAAWARNRRAAFTTGPR